MENDGHRLEVDRSHDCIRRARQKRIPIGLAVGRPADDAGEHEHLGIDDLEPHPTLFAGRGIGFGRPLGKRRHWHQAPVSRVGQPTARTGLSDSGHWSLLDRRRRGRGHPLTPGRRRARRLRRADDRAFAVRVYFPVGGQIGRRTLHREQPAHRLERARHAVKVAHRRQAYWCIGLPQSSINEPMFLLCSIRDYSVPAGFRDLYGNRAAHLWGRRHGSTTPGSCPINATPEAMRSPGRSSSSSPSKAGKPVGRRCRSRRRDPARGVPPIEYPDEFHAARSLHDAGMRGHAVEVRCQVCNRCRRFDPYALWWLFEQRGWNDKLSQVAKRFRCISCSIARRRVARSLVTIVDDPPNDDTLPRPDERTWRASVKRRRT